MILLHEKQTKYWLQIIPEVEALECEQEPDIEDFTLGPFDAERLGEVPPESNWSDWFPPPPRLTEWELDELADRVDVEAEKHDLNPDAYQIGVFFNEGKHDL